MVPRCILTTFIKSYFGSASRRNFANVAKPNALKYDARRRPEIFTLDGKSSFGMQFVFDVSSLYHICLFIATHFSINVPPVIYRFHAITGAFDVYQESKKLSSFRALVVGQPISDSIHWVALVQKPPTDDVSILRIGKERTKALVNRSFILSLDPPVAF